MKFDQSDSPDFESFEWDDVESGDASAVLNESASSSVPDEDASAAIGHHLPIDVPGGKSGRKPALRRATRPEGDPLFIYVVLMALSLGLSPTASSMPIGRYTLLWSLLAIILLAILVFGRDSSPIRIDVNDLVWGAGWGLVVGIPLLLVGAGLLAEASERIFVGLPDSAVFQTIVFVMVPVETMFFRHIIQGTRTASLTAVLSSGWSIMMFFPTLDVGGYPFVALIVGTFLVMLSLLYSYVRQRNGLMAAWVCQTLVSLAWLFLPRVLV